MLDFYPIHIYNIKGCDYMKAAFFTLGCKVNQYESQEISELLIKNGYEIVDSKQIADVYIVNSCTVTAESNRKTRQAVRHFKTVNPDSIVVLTGCVPQAFPDEATDLCGHADIILGNNNNYAIVENINKLLEQKERECIVNINQHTSDISYRGGIIKEFSGHTRAFVKIQDGCNRFCTYCAIPYARGRSRSKPINMISEELRNLASSGFKEVVFVGINLSAYGREIGLSLADAVILAENTDGIERIRLGSLEPDHITDEMLAVFASCKKFCPQFHISLQSGCDSVLKRMNRHYTSEEYLKLVKSIRNTFDESSITTDIIVGFPGETQDEFETTKEFVKIASFDKVHVFPYSVREGTKAAKMQEQIANSIKSTRAAELSKVAEETRKLNFAAIKNTTLSVLFETPKGEYQCGYTKNYTPVKVLCNENLCNEIRNVYITETYDDFCVGILA